MSQMRRCQGDGNALHRGELAFLRDYHTNPAEELYNLKDDPFEENNLAGSGEHAAKLAEPTTDPQRFPHSVACGNKATSHFVEKVKIDSLLMISLKHLSSVLLLFVLIPGVQSADPVLEGELTTWHPLTLTFEAGENDDAVNPALDFRLQVLFEGPEGKSFDVPGYFAGDGKGGESGRIWRVHFTPDQEGEWRYNASFRKGREIAVSLNSEAGDATEFDGKGGSFFVQKRDADASGYLKWGRLEYVGGHYLKFRDGPYWIRGGVDSPENFLAYAGFDNTPPKHHYADHAVDWHEGDPDWNGGKGKAIIGAINSLAEQKVNSLYFLTMNIGGDGKDVWPWAGVPKPKGHPDNENRIFDQSKLAQWEIVFAHAQRKGVALHLVFNEAEVPNKKELDEGELGVERKLYYRELIARFGHHNALFWNLCEEYNLGFDFGPDRIRAFADYIKAVDPYDHPITVHSAHDPMEALAFTFGDERFSMTSIQLNKRRIDTLVEDFRKATTEAGRPLPVSMDEFVLDVGQKQSWKPFDRAELHRKQKLWPTYFSGGQIEFILEDLLWVESFKKPRLQALWRNVGIARTFMETHLPFWEMEPADELLVGEATLNVGTGNEKSFGLDAQVLRKKGEVYAIYFPVATQTGELDLSEARGPFQTRWFNPRSGEFSGEKRNLAGGESVACGKPPGDAKEDWVLLLQRSEEGY